MGTFFYTEGSEWLERATRVGVGGGDIRHIWKSTEYAGNGGLWIMFRQLKVGFSITDIVG